jgi:hypothetical protein
MTESEYLIKLSQIWPTVKHKRASKSLKAVEGIQPRVKEALALTEVGLMEYPESVSLLCARGDLILLSESHSINDARKYYEMAIAVSPDNPEPYTLLGDYFDCTLDDPGAAVPRYSKSVELGGDVSAYTGLARSLAELGKREEALAVLSETRCPFARNPEIETLKREIENGLWEGLNPQKL